MDKYKCEFCNSDMEHDCSCGVWDKETHHFTCIECGSDLTLFENGQEPSWDKID